METTIALRLPRDAASVPLIREMLDGTLRSLGVDPQVRDDIELMLTEACSNVIKHAAPSDDYRVYAIVDDERCVIQVVDHGGGFDPRKIVDHGPGAEHGRGLQIMRALADDIRFANKGQDGAMVCLEKRLRYAPGAAGSHLMTT
ncbi:ATP-binding protein [Nonomuraea sp. KC401]|uniref:ATP-binding protein n=1 Tax=unclassified Nonomuraea TaxID=2593643 RepID=UPI0010FD7EC0|nr:ATP-binding protein [Nonomuraea sp. KC401]NBE97652.1 ATP-binding protein [Nonomuraea sp. K271]TLF71387.1 ATP-binding protein [Nonomuraea sp. KC401]